MVSTRIVTVPNLLSFFRLLLIPVFLGLLISGQYVLALLTLVVSSFTDLLDGQLARRFNQVSRLGQLLDPAADRLYILAALLGLAARDLLPWWLVIVIVARDVMLLILGFVLANHGYGPLPVHHLGKMGTFLLLVALPLLVIGAAFPVVGQYSNPVAWAAALWGVFIYWWAGAVYVAQTVGLVREVRAAGGVRALKAAREAAEGSPTSGELGDTGARASDTLGD